MEKAVITHTLELIDKVLYYKGRVWTIYALTGNYDGIFAYGGLKPYATFRYDSDRSDRDLVYLNMEETLDCIIEGERIQECIKLEKAAGSKKLSKKMAVEFLADLTGHGKTKINTEINEDYANHFSILLGRIKYTLYKQDGRLKLLHNMQGNTTGTTFDFVTWKHDSRYEDRENRKERREETENIINDYKYKHDCSCDNKR